MKHIDKYLTKEFRTKWKHANITTKRCWKIMDEWVSDNDDILELGCGENPYSDRSFKIDIMGCDMKHDLNYPFNLNRKFDVIIGQQIIEDLYNPEIFLQSCHRNLKPMGLLILSSDNILHWKRRIKFLLGNWKKFDGLTVSFFTPYRLMKLLEHEGFHVLKTYVVGRLKVPLSLCGFFMTIAKRIDLK